MGSPATRQRVMHGDATITFSPASAFAGVLPRYGIFPGEVVPGWEMRRFLPLTISADDDGWYILSDDVFQVYGDGESLLAARADYIASLLEYYTLVENGAQRGSANDARELDRLRQHLRPLSR